MNLQFDEAIRTYRGTLDPHPQFECGRTRLGMTCVARGAYRDAIREFEIAKDLTGSDPYLDGILGYTLAMSGNTAKAYVLCGIRFPLDTILVCCRHIAYRSRALELPFPTQHFS